MPKSLFPRPNGLRQTMQTQGAARTAIEVRSEDELRAAIARVAASNGATLGTSVGGREIVISGPFVITDTVNIPAECRGLTVRSAGVYSIGFSNSAIDPVFAVFAPNVTIDGLVVNNVGQLGARAVFVAAGLASVGADNLTIRRCTIFMDTIYSDTIASTPPNNVRIIENDATNVGDPSIEFVVFSGDGALVLGNTFAVASIYAVRAEGGRMRIIGNNLGGAGVITTVGTGNNVIAGNVDTGTLTTLGSDQAGLNT